MLIQKVTDPSFRKYGRVIKNVDLTELVEAMKSTPCPDAVIYVAGDPELEKLAASKNLQDIYFGELPIEVGYCNGHNNKLNAVVNRYLKVPMTYLGAVPQDEQLRKAVMAQTPVSLENPKAKSALAYEEIANVLMNKESNKSIKIRGMAAFFSHIVAGKKTV